MVKIFHSHEFFCPESLQAFLKHICMYVCTYYTHINTLPRAIKQIWINIFAGVCTTDSPQIFNSQVSLCLHVFMHTHRLCTCEHLRDQSAKFFRVSSELSSCLPSLKQHCWAWVFCCGFLPISGPPILPSPSRVKAFFPHKLMHCSIK